MTFILTYPGTGSARAYVLNEQQFNSFLDRLHSREASQVERKGSWHCFVENKLWASYYLTACSPLHSTNFGLSISNANSRLIGDARRVRGGSEGGRGGEGDASRWPHRQRYKHGYLKKCTSKKQLSLVVSNTRFSLSFVPETLNRWENAVLYQGLNCFICISAFLCPVRVWQSVLKPDKGQQHNLWREKYLSYWKAFVKYAQHWFNQFMIVKIPSSEFNFFW